MEYVTNSSASLFLSEDNFTTTTTSSTSTQAGGGGGNNAASDRVLSIQSDVVIWSIIDGLLVITILGGNTLTILALRFSRRLRSVISNMFVLSLAVSDLVVGFTLPYHLAFYMTAGLGRVAGLCLLRFFLIILACCVSIWNLTAIAVDRYIAIMYPLHYSRYMNKRVAIILLSFGWSLSFILASIPMFWNNWQTAEECEFDEVLPPWYMAGVITPLFSVVWACLLFAYFRIWCEASRQVKQLRNTPFTDRVSDWKSVQVVLLILGCFSICWLPYFIVACIQIFSIFDHSSPILYKAAFSLAMANSGMNPVIYAWKNKNFRRAFALLLRCKNPDIAYRGNCHIEPKNNNNNNNSPRRDAKNKQFAGTAAVAVSGSDTNRDSEENCSVSERQQRQCCAAIRRDQNNSSSGNSQSMVVDEMLYVPTIAGQLDSCRHNGTATIITRTLEKKDSCIGRGDEINGIESIVGSSTLFNSSCTATNISSASSSTGTEFIDDTFRGHVT